MQIASPYGSVVRKADLEEEAKQPSVQLRLSVALGLGLFFLVADRVSKYFIQAALLPDPFTGDHFTAPFIPGVLSLCYTQNTGAAFSLGEGQGLLFVVFAAVVIVACIVYLVKTPKISILEATGMGMLMGGAVGNAFDRLVFGYVIDFLKTEFISFPIFNVADIGVTCGVALAFIGYLFLSPASREVDATEELNRRDAEARAKRAAKKSGDK